MVAPQPLTPDRAAKPHRSAHSEAGGARDLAPRVRDLDVSTPVDVEFLPALVELRDEEFTEVIDRVGDVRRLGLRRCPAVQIDVERRTLLPQTLDQPIGFAALDNGQPNNLAHGTSLTGIRGGGSNRT
jgi:hypothetical protein